jgi:hypothetical protein
MKPTGLDALIEDWLEGRLSEPDTARLSVLLEQSPEARARYWETASIHGLLEHALQETSWRAMTGQSLPVTSARPRFRSWRPFAAAVAGLVMLAGGWWLNQAADGRAVAHFGPLHQCRWVDGRLVVSPGDPIHAGQRVELASGQVEMRFRSGAVATLMGPCIFEVESDKGGFLTLGQIATRADTPESKGFTVRTRTSRVVDLGTEFVTAASADGQSRVEVTSGEVDVHVDGTPRPQRLRKGDVLSVEAGSARVMARIERGDETPSFHFPSIEPPSPADYADVRQGHASLLLVSGALHKAPAPTASSGTLDVLTNGRGQSRRDAPTESVFMSDGTAGWLMMDLGSLVQVTRINSYSWHQDLAQEDNRLRAVQQFVLYGSAAPLPPPMPDNDASPSGWDQVARVNTDEFFQVIGRADRPAQQASSITSTLGTLGRYRYLLWHLQPSRDPVSRQLNNTFYGELDVYVRP